MAEAAVALCDLLPGGRGKVVTLGSASARQRLLELGLTPGTVVEVVRFAPLGDPVEVRVRGYLLSLRRDEAACVRVMRA